MRLAMYEACCVLTGLCCRQDAVSGGDLRDFMFAFFQDLPTWGLWTVIGLIALFGAWVLAQILRVLRWLRMSNYRSIGKRGEISALQILADAGYTIEGSQVARKYYVRVDGVDKEVLLRADFLVRKDGASYIAEAKGGLIVSNPLHTPTRRQLLEYEVVFGASGILLVDVPRKKVVRVEFPLGR